MIGSALKKFAKENGLKVDSGVAYGVYRGYTVTLWEGAGFKTICFSTKFTDAVKKQEFLNEIGSTDIAKEYRVQQFNATTQAIQIVFTDNPGTMKKIYAFLDWFFPILDRHGAPKATVCPECGCEITSGKWILVEGVAYYMHDACAQRAMEQIQDSNTREAEERTGSYVTGFIGALIGALIGAIVWAFVLYHGYVASLVGLLIGFLADKGYDLLKGKQGKGKVFILALVVILAVVVGNFATDAYTIFSMINSGELYGFAAADIPMLIYTLLVEDAAYAGAVAKNILTGLLFAGLGVFAILAKASKSGAGVKCKYLKG